MPTTQSVLDNTKSLLERIKTEGITANGVPQPISAETLNTSLRAVNLPQVDQTWTPPIENIPTEKTGTDGLKTLFDEYIGNQTAPPSLSEEYTKAQGEAGIEAKSQAVVQAQQQLDVLNAQLAGMTGATQAKELQIGKEGISTGAIKGRTIEEERNLAIRAIPLQAQILAQQAVVTGNQGLLKLAQDKLSTLFELKTKDSENQYNYKTKLIDSVYDFATKQEQAKLDAKKLQEERAYNDRVNNLNQAQNWATTAITQGQGDLAAQIMALDPKDKNYQTKLGQLAGQITVQPDLKYQELPDGRSVMLDKNGNIVKVISGGTNTSTSEVPVGSPAEIKNSATITNIISNSKIGQTTKTNLANILGVINASEDLSKANQIKGFKGISPLNALLDIKIPFTEIGLPFRQTLKSKEAVKTEGYINAINLKVQQWASGAALTKQQTEQVERFTPKMTDTDEKVRTKLNNLTNFMYTQAKSTLQSEGINYNPDKVNLFEVYDLYKKATPTQRKEIETLINK